MPKLSTKNCGVYQFLNVRNGKRYVGSSTNVYYRKQTHEDKLRKGEHWNVHLQRAWDKHGEAAFEFSVVEWCVPKLKLIREQFYIDKFDAVRSGYNLAPRAGDGTDLMHAKEREHGPTDKQRHARRGNMVAARKIRENNQRMLKKEREETGIDNRPAEKLERLKELGSQMGKQRKGKKPWCAGTTGLIVVGNEQRKKLGEKSKQAWANPETRARILAAQAASKERSTATLRETMKTKRAWNYETKGVIKVSEEQKRKCSEASKARWADPKFRAKMKAARAAARDERRRASV